MLHVFLHMHEDVKTSVKNAMLEEDTKNVI